MIVCHLTSVHRRYDGRVFEKECTWSAKAGFNVYLIVNDDKPRENKNGVQILSTGMIFNSRKARMLKGAKAVYELAKEVNADIYHFHDPELLPYGMKLKRAGKIVIFDSHEDYKSQIKEKGYIFPFFRSVIAMAYFTYETYVCKSIDAAIVAGPCGNNKTIFTGRCKRDLVIGNLPILDNDRDVDIKGNLEKRVICQTGTLAEARGITEMVRAGYKTNSRIILAGFFPTSEYRDKVKSLKEYVCVDYRGFINHEKINTIFKESGIGISTVHPVGEYKEAKNLPTKVYEYAAYGLPIIASNFPESVRHFLEDEHCGITVNPLDPDDIARAINYLYEHPDEAVQMGQNGKRIVERDYNWERDAQKLVDLYIELAKVYSLDV